MKVGKTSDAEIQTVFDFMNELSWLHDALRRTSFEDVDFSEFTLLKRMDTSSAETLLYDLAHYAKNCFYERVLVNCHVMLENCADKDLNYLDFNPDIKRGSELLEQERKQNSSNVEG